MLSWIYWNPKKEIFTIPYLEQPILWYGFLFALGFYLAYYLFKIVTRRYFQLDPYFYLSDIKQGGVFLLELQKFRHEPLVHEFLQYVPGPLREKILNPENDLSNEHFSNKALMYSLNHYLESKGSKKGQKRVLLQKILSNVLVTLEEKVSFLADKLFLYLVIGTVIGARLGHILFYENLDYFIENPLSIVKTWEGGLASHGGIAGIVIAILLFARKYQESFPNITFLRICDLVAVEIPFVAIFIRFGNFFNQEILGKPSELPWAILFGSPASHGLSYPRHPVVLYEAFSYLLLFVVLFSLTRIPSIIKKPGRIFAFLSVLASLIRFFLEFFKESQSVYDGNLLNMGQILTLPFFLFGILWLSIDYYRSRNVFEKKIC